MRVVIKQSKGSDDSDEDLLDVRPAFELPPPLPEDADLSMPPMSGEQFLQRVIQEAKSLEATPVADAMSIPLQWASKSTDLYMPDVNLCNTEFLPSKDYQLSTIADFSQLRLRMEELRGKLQLRDTDHSDLRASLPKADDYDEWLKLCLQKDGTYPSTKLCLAIPQVKLWSLLGHLRDWLNDGEMSVEDVCRWIYSLLACLELPIEANVYSTLRQISRAFINRRSLLESLKSEELPHLNLVICIVGRYFDQTDLADPFFEDQED